LGHRSDRFSYGYLLGIMALPAQHRILPLRGGVAQTEYVQGNVGHLEACVIGYYLNSGGNGCNLEGHAEGQIGYLSGRGKGFRSRGAGDRRTIYNQANRQRSGNRGAGIYRGRTVEGGLINSRLVDLYV